VVVTITLQPNATKPVILFESESPFLQYNIRVYTPDMGFSPNFCGQPGESTP
jgi:hypothetical protein